MIFYAFILFCLPFSLFASKPEIDLAPYDSAIYSQNGEDGIIDIIFKIIAPTTKYYVEFGGYDGYLASNTRYLREQGWQGLLMDGDYEDLTINLQREFITAENINALFEKYHVPCNFDLLSIDIDYNDFYVWNALDEKYRPALVVIEYNATHLPTEDKVVKYDPTFSGDGTNYFGASILSFYHLGRKKGYSLIYAENQGVNLFFLRDDLVSACDFHFKNINDVEKLYAYPQYGKGPNGGHREDPYFRDYLKSTDLLSNRLKKRVLRKTKNYFLSK